MTPKILFAGFNICGLTYITLVLDYVNKFKQKKLIFFIQQLLSNENFIEWTSEKFHGWLEKVLPAREDLTIYRAIMFFTSKKQTLIYC